jgi:dienelactone hydrolase
VDGEAERLRADYRDNLVLRGVPEAWRDHDVRVEWTEDIETDYGYRIRKLRYEALPSLWIPALLYEPSTVEGNVPAVLDVNGHSGQPGKSSAEEQIRCINLAKRGMIALHPEWFACGELVSEDYEHYRLAYLDLVGISGLSVFHYALERALDVLVNDPRVDAERIAMTGLSGGGWQTTVFSAIDERVRVVVPNAGHSGFELRVNGLRNMGDLEQAPVDLLTIADYSHLTALFAPRPALLIYNAADNCCFTAHEALPTVYDPVVPVYEAYGRADHFKFHVNEDPGTHNYAEDNRIQFYTFIERYFLPEAKRFDGEIPSDDEVRTFDDLAVGLPEDNATFESLALAHALDVQRPAYENVEQAQTKLREIVRLPDVAQDATIVREQSFDDVRVTTIQFESPFGAYNGVLFEPTGAQIGLAVFVSDEPLAESIDFVLMGLERGVAILAVEPSFLGANQPGGDHAWQYAMALQAAGERTLGIQAAQIAAACDWLRDAKANESVFIITEGKKSVLAGLAAAATVDTRVDLLELHDGLDSLVEPIEINLDWKSNQSLFCFGLQPAFELERSYWPC